MPFDKAKKILLITNPTAGKQRAKAGVTSAADLFLEKGYITTALTTTKKGDAAEFVEEFAGQHDMVVCCGGDGTLNEIISGLMQAESRIPIGYIPAGTTNDMAKTLHLSKNIKKAVYVVLNGQPVYQDIGIFNNTDYFSYVASFGAFTKVSYATPQWMKNKFGHLAYVLDGIRSVGDIHPYRLKVTADGLEEEGEFVYGSVTNSSSVGGIIQFKREDVCLNDGQFEVLLVRNPTNPVEVRSIFYGLIHHNYNKNNVLFFHAKEISFQFEQETSWTVDGEFAGRPREVHIKNLHNAVQIIRKQ